MTHTSVDEFNAKLKQFHPTKDQANRALQRLINHEHVLHVPPMITDEDMLLGRVIDEREELQEAVTKLVEALEAVDNAWDGEEHTAYDAGWKIDDIVRQALADYRGTSGGDAQ